jgi:hypothetical protein
VSWDPSQVSPNLLPQDPAWTDATATRMNCLLAKRTKVPLTEIRSSTGYTSRNSMLTTDCQKLLSQEKVKERMREGLATSAASLTEFANVFVRIWGGNLLVTDIFIF